MNANSAASSQPYPPASSPDRPRRQIPSRRNREVFAAVVMGKSQERVAKETGLTQPRVAQIVRQVRDWTAQTLGGESFGYTEIQQLRLAQVTLELQLEGWLEMVMQQWHASCETQSPRAGLFSQARMLASHKARLAGVDLSGKIVRQLAQQQEEAARRERDNRQRALREGMTSHLATAEKPLWKPEPEEAPRGAARFPKADASPSPAATCHSQRREALPAAPPAANEKNSYILERPEPLEAPVPPAALLKCEPRQASEAASVAMRRDARQEPIPKFLDKKARKRLLELRRQRARAEALAAVG